MRLRRALREEVRRLPTPVRTWARQVHDAVRGIRELRRALGAQGAAVYVGQKARHAHLPARRPYRLRSSRSRYSLFCRPSTSDLEVFHQIFIAHEYEPLDDLTDVTLVIDCGANVGYSAAYFLSRFPACHVIAVEPDLENVRLLSRNLAPFRDRATIMPTGVWSHPADLRIEEAVYRDGDKWTTQVRECRPGEVTQMKAVDVPALIALSGEHRVSLLKVDIEGAEVIVFGPGCHEWLPRVDNIAIELHDDSSFGSATEPFFSAIAHYPFDVSTAGELTLCRTIT